MSHPPLPTAVLAVACGGAVGAVLRWWAGELVPDGTGFAWTTFTVNVVGCALLALLPAVLVGRVRPRTEAVAAVFLGPGVLGGFTTLSSYSEQTRALLADGRTALAATYLIGTLATCLVAVAAADRLSTLAQRTRFADEGGDE